jgi:DNA-binding transcriptional MocR family regulator/dihydrodipicolinate reductase
MTSIEYGQYRVPPASEMVNLGVGQPAPRLLPLARIRAAASAKFAEDDPLFLQYGSIPGYPAFRASLARFLSSAYGFAVDPALLFVTNGVTGALALYCSLFCARGDVVLCENPSYFLALSIFRDFGLRVVPVPLDADGIDVGALGALLAADASLRPRFLYTIPAFQNPTGVNMSAARRAALVALADKHDFHVLADEVYQLLSFPGAAAPPPPLATFDAAGGRVISIGSFAKILAPGLRLGWLQVSPAGAPLLARMAACGQLDSSGALNPVISGIAHTMIESGSQAEHLAAVRAELGARAAALGDALRAALPPGATFTQPTGGYFVWIRLPAGVDGAALLDRAARDHRVRFQPGARFGSGLEGCIRLSFSYYDAEDLVEGARRLGDAIRAALAAPPAAPPTPPAPPALPSVAVHGATGRLGSLILGAAAAADAGALVRACVAAPRGGAPLPADVDVVLDVSLPAGTAALVAALTARGAPYPALVVGTTGVLPRDALAAYAALAPVAIFSNFSTGVPLLSTMLCVAAGALPAGWHAAVTEEHHVKKVDAPSGTAKTLVGVLADARVAPFGGVPGDAVPVHARRLGDTIGVHTVHLVGPGERLDITHTATARDVFARGALRAAAWIKGQPNGLYVK